MSGKTTIPYFDRNHVEKQALAGSDSAGNTVTGSTLFDINGVPLNPATKEGLESLGNKLDTANDKLAAAVTRTTALSDAFGTMNDAPAQPAEPATAIALFKAIFNRLGGVVLAASNAIIGRVVLADQAGTPYSGTNKLLVSDPSIAPSSDSIEIELDYNYAGDYPSGLLLRASTAGTVDVTTLSGNRRIMNFIAGETRSVRVLKVWSGANTTATGLEGMP